MESVLMAKLSKYVDIIKRFGVSITNLRQLKSPEDIDQYLMDYMKKICDKEMGRLHGVEYNRKKEIEEFTRDFKSKL
jgi:predicted HicB family RNase H-like nuclease